MGSPFGKALTTPPVAGLAYDTVTYRAKRRPQGSRVKRRFGPEITNRCADISKLMEGNTCTYRYGEILHGTAGFEVSHAAHRDIASTGESLIGSMESVLHGMPDN